MPRVQLVVSKKAPQTHTTTRRRKATIAGCTCFSDEFGIAAADFRKTGAFDLIINRDSPLMIDPRLLRTSGVKELNDSYDRVLRRFRLILKNLEKCSAENDRFWRVAYKLTEFSEFRGVSLGYSLNSQHGKGWASALRLRVLRSAREVVTAGLSDPEFFELLAIFEPGIGADRVSDMIGTILLDPLCAFTKRVCKRLDIKTKTFTIKGFRYQLPWTKGEAGDDRYIILVPDDILTDVSVGVDRSAISEIIAENTALRRYLNSEIGRDWRSRIKVANSKDMTRAALFGNIGAFKEVIARYRASVATPYDFDADPENVVFWYKSVRNSLKVKKLKITMPAKPTLKALLGAARSMALYLQRSVEDRALRDDFFSGGVLREERTMQAVFLAMIQTHRDHNDLAISLRPNKSRGAVDFCAKRSNYVVLVRLKVSNSTKLVEYFDELLEADRRSNGSRQSLFIVLQIKDTAVNIARLKARVAATPSSRFKPELILINAYNQ